MSRPQLPNIRKSSLPGTLVLKWRTDDNISPKPLQRRPMTACNLCRSGKVKCDSQTECQRCRSRGLQCIYSNPSHSNKLQKMPPSTDQVPSISKVDPVTTPAPSNDVPNQMLMECLPAPDPFSFDGIDAMDWHDGSFDEALEQFNWVFPDTIHNTEGVAETLENPPGTINAPLDRGSQCRTADKPLTMALSLPNESEDAEQPPGLANMSDLIEAPNLVSALLENCNCRAMLVSNVPTLDSVLKVKPSPRLDSVLKTTEDIISSCQAVVACPRCQMGSVDLVCIMTVFQQTAACFNHIAKEGLRGNMKVSIGSYEVSLEDDMMFKRILVGNLIEQANTFLDTLSMLGQSMSLSQSSASSSYNFISRSPVCLNQLNLDYIREVIANFKKYFRLMKHVLEGKENENR